MGLFRDTRRISFRLLSITALVCTSGCSSDDLGSLSSANNPPSISRVEITPSTVAAGGVATVTVSASDPDDDPLTFVFHVSGGIINPVGPVSIQSATWTAPSNAGSYKVTVTVLDPEGLTASAQETLAVTSPSPPTGIEGTVAVHSGQVGNLLGTRIAFYEDLEGWSSDQPLRVLFVEEDGESITFNFVDVLVGTYYLDVWKDANDDGVVNTGDLLGWFGTDVYPSGQIRSFQVIQGQMTQLGTIVVSVMP
jgi:uncharacterized protein (DUF2141 family)